MKIQKKKGKRKEQYFFHGFVLSLPHYSCAHNKFLVTQYGIRLDMKYNTNLVILFFKFSKYIRYCEKKVCLISLLMNEILILHILQTNFKAELLHK